MEETHKNDSQDVQPETNEQVTDTPVVTDDQEVDTVETVDTEEVEKLRQEIADKDKQIADLSRLKREQKKEAKKSVPKAKANQDSDELDYGQKAYLQQNNVEEKYHDFVQEELTESGLELKELLSNGYFNSKLQALRDADAVKAATPSNTRGATKPANSQVEYWLDKGELPPDSPDNRDLRIKVVNARIKRNEAASNFTSNPIVEG